MPSAKPKMNPKATIRFSSRWPKSRKMRTTRAGFSLEVVDHHDLRVEQLVDVLADLVGHRAYDARQLGLHPGDHGLARARRQVAPQRRVLAAS